MLEALFKLKQNGTTTSRELAAGTTTFLTMAYIIFVNPNILSATGMDTGALITATILAAACGTILAGLWANVPFAMAPGMGLNAFFAYSLVIGQKVTWQTALGVVFISGIVFLVLTLAGVRKHIIAAIPLELRLAIAADIAEGGRTGLANLMTGLLFLSALIVTPLIGMVPLLPPHRP